MLQEELEKLEMYKSQSTDKETIISEIQTAVKTISFHIKELRPSQQAHFSPHTGHMRGNLRTTVGRRIRTAYASATHFSRGPHAASHKHLRRAPYKPYTAALIFCYPSPPPPLPPPAFHSLLPFSKCLSSIHGCLITSSVTQRLSLYARCTPMSDDAAIAPPPNRTV